MEHEATGNQSRVEFDDGGQLFYDYRTAYYRAGDPDYQTPIPEMCAKCRRNKEVFTEAGLTPPTEVDQEVTHGD